MDRKFPTRIFVGPRAGSPGSCDAGASRNLDLSERHRTRAESLMSLALELNSLLKLPDLARASLAVPRHAGSADGGISG